MTTHGSKTKQWRRHKGYIFQRQLLIYFKFIRFKFIRFRFIRFKPRNYILTANFSQSLSKNLAKKIRVRDSDFVNPVKTPNL